MPLTRREVLIQSLGVGGALALSQVLSRARAARATPSDPHRRFVFVYFPGGWDPILTLDPKDPAVYDDREETILETGVQTGYGDLGFSSDPRIFTDVEGMVFGPYLGSRMAALAPKLAVVRGMAVSSVAHAPAIVHAITGREPAGELPRGSSIPTLLASVLGSDDLIPNLSAGVDSWNLTEPDYASALSAATGRDLTKILQPGLLDLEASERDAIEAFFAAEAERMRNPRMSSVLGRRRSSRMLIEQDVAAFFDDTNPDLAELVGYFDNHPKAFVTYQALTTGTSRCVSYPAHNFSDAHFGGDWRGTHRYFLQSGFDGVALLAERLDDTAHPEGGSWLDHTTIVCFSEFNRSPALNASGGRDHATTNSMLLLGAGIQGGTLVGETHPIRMAGQPIELATGQVDADSGVQLEHAHIARTLLESIGVTEDIGDFRVPPVPALLA